MVEKPWRVLRDRPEIEFVLCNLPMGVKAIHARRGGDRAILVSRDLDPAERLAAIAHELVHDDRGGGCHDPDLPPLLRVATAREEARVQAIVVDQLVPPTALAEYVRRRGDEMTVAWMVADEFGVPADVASLALDRLASGF